MEYADILSSTIDFARESVRADQRCLLDVMQNHGSGLVQMLWRILGNQADVADAYQEIFCRLAVMLHEGRSWNKTGYIYRIASNIAIDMLRRRKHFCQVQDDIGQASTLESDPASVFEQKDQRQRLRDAIGNLPDHLRHALVLREFAELDYHVIASEMRISTATARQYRHRAMRTLAVILKVSKEK